MMTVPIESKSENEYSFMLQTLKHRDDVITPVNLLFVLLHDADARPRDKIQRCARAIGSPEILCGL